MILMQEREVKAKHQQLISGVCLSFRKEKKMAAIFDSFSTIMEIDILLHPCAGFYTFILDFYIYMGLCQLLISFIFRNNSFLHLWYVCKLSLQILSLR